MAGSGSANSSATGSILDAIFEKTANVEAATNVQIMRKFVSEALRVQASRERNLREATITFKFTEKVTHADIIAAIEEWTVKSDQLPPTFWQDREHSYCQLDSKHTKKALIDHIGSNEQLKQVLLPPNLLGLHFTRRQAKVEIANVRQNIKLDTIQHMLELATSSFDDLREGKANVVTKARSVFFKADALAVRHLFIALGGMLPYTNKATNTRTKLHMKINVKPWQCRDCYRFGQHDCKGKRCAQCGSTEHSGKDCKNKTKFCDTCKKKGHKAKEAHCPSYLAEVAKELRKIDIPLEFFEDKDLRFLITQYLQYK